MWLQQAHIYPVVVTVIVTSNLVRVTMLRTILFIYNTEEGNTTVSTSLYFVRRKDSFIYIAIILTTPTIYYCKGFTPK